MLIYKITNTLNNKVYIGQTVNSLRERRNSHKTQSKISLYPIHKAIREYGWENFEWEILHKNVPDLFTLDTLERYEIYKHDSFYNGYNCTKGGRDAEISEQTKEKLSLAKSGKNHYRYKDINMDDLMEYYYDGCTQKELAYIFNTTQSVISQRYNEYKKNQTEKQKRKQLMYK